MALPVYLLAQSAAPHNQPNIVFILADDLGWSDIGCYGNTDVSTPNLNKLALEGVLFSDAYAPAPICSPSRAAFLTGKSPARLHFEFVSKPDGSKAPAGTRLQQPAYPRDLPLEEITLAEAIDSTYATGFFGKWHLTQENDRYLGWGDTFGPLQQGFDKGSEARGSHPYAYSKEEKKTFGNFQRGEYPEDALTGEAIAFLKSVKGQPFLLYYSMYYVHTPVQTRCKWLYDKYKKLQGAAATEKSVHYAAFLETMDAYVGQLLEALEETGQAENTVVIFISDNGGHPSFAADGGLKGSKWNLYEGGIRVPMIVRWPGVVKPGSVCGIPVTGMDVFPTIYSITGAKAGLASSEANLSGAHDGADITPLLRDPSGAGWKREMLYWHFPYYHPDFVNTKPQSSIREGRYKLLYFYEEGGIELYDLIKDPGESRDLSLAMPDKASRMKADLFNELEKVKARFPLVKN